MDSQKIADIYKELKDKRFSVIYATESFAEQTLKIDKEAAKAKGLVDKEGKPDASKIKTGLMKKGIEKYLTQKDKLKEDHDIMEDYLSLIKSGKISKEDITTLTTREQLKKDEASEFNALKKTKESEIDAETFQAILVVIKEDEERYKNNAKGDSDAAEEYKPRNVEELFKKVNEVRKIIKGIQ